MVADVHPIAHPPKTKRMVRTSCWPRVASTIYKIMPQAIAQPMR
jgi:hypothetical protein